ncbi:1-deoxy-D-xylulose-5-phosphate reductoisomerase [bacterium]|nr:1-deoxy-D-xylulose-5-phosphate reductoisomerase [bacterium]
MRVSENSSSASVSEGKLRVAVLGSTGSIGTQTLEIARLFKEKIKIVVLTAGQNVDLLERQAAEFLPECVVIGSKERARSEAHRFSCTVLGGENALVEAASWPKVDIVVTALVGAVGLRPTVAALKLGRRIALANKETMVVAGDLVQQLAQKHGAEIIPVDSEHSAIFQCLLGERSSEVRKLILTASGGPFRDRSLDTFNSISKQEALNHPNWEMGAKITIDSATMMNKALEVIEARWLFDLPPEKIDVVIHPQSIIHSMVQFVDGSTKAQLGPPDMKVPIQYALSTPSRWEAPHPVVHWDMDQTLSFSAPNAERYPSLVLAYEALNQAGAVPAILNAANEVAVDLFLKDHISFRRITTLVREVMASCTNRPENEIEARMEADQEARRKGVELAGAANH